MEAPTRASDTLTLVHNQGLSNHEAILLRALANADEVYISVAFVMNHAIRSVLPALQSALGTGASATIIVGGDFYLTEPEALTALYRLCHPYHPRARACLVQPGQETFHPKAYCFVRGQAVTMLVGSANLTGGGLHSNFELSLIHTTDSLSPIFQAFKSWLAAAQAHKRVTELDDLAIGSYQLKYAIYKKLTRSAERKARAEIKRQYTLDSALLRQYVKEYKADQSEQSFWVEKQSNYRQAREVLDSMINTAPTTRAAFLASYGGLVGAHGSRHLWHSGSIFRAKNKVADQYPKFLAMLRALHPAIGGRPEEVFQLGLSHAESIPGLGPNVLTEIMNTYAPSIYSVLNKNPIGSLQKMGIARYPDPGAFRPETYAQYNRPHGEPCGPLWFRGPLPG